MAEADPPPVPVTDEVLRQIVWAVGLDALKKPSKAMRERIVAGLRRFVFDSLTTSGLVSLNVRFVLPDLRKEKAVPSPTRVISDYGHAFDRAKDVWARHSLETRMKDREAVLSRAFPKTPRRRFEGCRRPEDAAREAVADKHSLSAKTIRRMVSSPPKRLDAYLALERLAAGGCLDLPVIKAIRYARGIRLT